MQVSTHTDSLIVGHKPIVFISGLHFDFTDDTYNLESASRMMDDFIAYVKKNHAGSILCLAGDYFNGYGHTAKFVQKLDENQVEGFFVLGNRDYWNTEGHTIPEIVELFRNGTRNHKYFKFLCTGEKYYVNDLCIIGDTGWTSLCRGDVRINDSILKKSTDAKYIRDYTGDTVVGLHADWVSYANEVIADELKTLVLTHFPMADFTQTDADVCWSSTTALDSSVCWCIHGRGEGIRQCSQTANHIVAWRGYANKSAESLKKWACSVKFGKTVGVDETSIFIDETARKSYIAEAYRLHKGMLLSEMSDTAAVAEYRRRKKVYVDKHWESTETMNQYEFSTAITCGSDFASLYYVSEAKSEVTGTTEDFAWVYSPSIVASDNPNKQVEISRRGYLRCSTNAVHVAAFASNPQKFIAKLFEKIDTCIDENSRSGMVYSRFMSKDALRSVLSAKNNFSAFTPSGDARLFFLSGIVASYILNGIPSMLNGMAHIDDYDLFRYWLLYITTQKFCSDKVSAIKVGESKKSAVLFGGVRIKLPTVNGMELTETEVKGRLVNTVFAGI